MFGVIDCSGKQQCIFIPGEITPLHFYCEEHRFVLPALLLTLLRRARYWGNDEFLSQNYSATLEICHASCFLPYTEVKLATRNMDVGHIRETCVFPALQLNTTCARFHQKCFAALKDGC